MGHSFDLITEPMSNPTNIPSRKPFCKPTKQMDLDAELPNNLSSTRVKYSLSQKQDAELRSKITDMQNTQTCGLCHNKKSELESLVEQPLAATDSSQRGYATVQNQSWNLKQGSQLLQPTVPKVGYATVKNQSWNL